MNPLPSDSDLSAAAGPRGVLFSERLMRWGWVPLATLGGLGYAPVAPGTVGSLAVAILVWVWGPVSPAMLCTLAALGLVIGVPAATALERRWGKDPHPVVIDEAVGMLIALLWVPMVPAWGAVVAFAGFRFFDVVKPFPCRRLEHIPGGWGVMLDDVMAGLYACGVVHLFLRWLP